MPIGECEHKSTLDLRGGAVPMMGLEKQSPTFSELEVWSTQNVFTWRLFATQNATKWVTVTFEVRQIQRRMDLHQHLASQLPKAATRWKRKVEERERKHDRIGEPGRSKGGRIVVVNA